VFNPHEGREQVMLLYDLSDQILGMLVTEVLWLSGSCEQITTDARLSSDRS
jgi:hypothetical protein